MVFPSYLFALDIQGAHKLVDMFDSYSQVERLFINYDCTFDNLDNLQLQCDAIIHDDMHNIIINTTEMSSNYTVSIRYLRMHFQCFNGRKDTEIMFQKDIASAKRLSNQRCFEFFF